MLFSKRSLGQAAPPEKAALASAGDEATAPVKWSNALLRMVVFLCTAVGTTVALWVVAVTQVSPLQVDIVHTAGQVSPVTPLTISVFRLGAEISGVTLTQEGIAPGGGSFAMRTLPVKLVPAEGGPFPGLFTSIKLESPSGGRVLDYDSHYRLQVDYLAPVLAFPPRWEEPFTRVYDFDTLTTPKLLAGEGVVEVGYQKPAELHFTEPIADFAVEVSPSLSVKSWTDPMDARTGYVDLKAAGEGQTLQIRVTRAIGTNSAPLSGPASVTVETAAPPVPLVEKAQLQEGSRIVLLWDHPIKDFAYGVEPAVASTLQIDSKDPRRSYIELKGAKQEQEYRVSITSGTARSGAPMAKPYKFSVVTPKALEVAKVEPADGDYGVRLDSRISVAFSRPIRDHAAAEAAISIAPAIAGHFEWVTPDVVQFVPSKGLPEYTDVTVKIAGGPGAARGEDGEYLEEPREFTFMTRPNKLIEVDLTRQKMTLYEGEKPVWTGLVATGVRGADTPTGEYMVEVKLPTTRMKGTNVDGSKYDIPDVPWVMPFFQDYTIHGAPWRARFGVPGSNGCVSMETTSAKLVFDWATVGTPIKIHY